MSFNIGTYSSTELLEEIKELMKDERLTQTALAKELGYSRKALNQFLNGNTVYQDFGLIVLLCKRLGIKAITID